VGFEKCDKALLVDNLKKDRVDGAWDFMADYRVIMRSDYNVLCLYTSGYVKEGNRRLAREYQNSVGTHHCNLQSRHDETVPIDIRQCISL
jgi:hypothetical protein